jgi:hypothetical protein
VEPGVSWDMVNLIIHRSFPRHPVTPPCSSAVRGAGQGRSRMFRKQLFRKQA